MATISGFSFLSSISLTKSLLPPFPSSSSLRIPLRFAHLQSHGCRLNTNFHQRKVARSVAEGIVISEEASTTDQTVALPISPADVLTMFFQAEGAMNERAIPTVTNALEAVEGITNLKIQVVEGIASVELMKETTVQETGVASNLVEIIQGSGFTLQTLNLSFEDGESIN